MRCPSSSRPIVMCRGTLPGEPVSDLGIALEPAECLVQDAVDLRWRPLTRKTADEMLGDEQDLPPVLSRTTAISHECPSRR